MEGWENDRKLRSYVYLAMFAAVLSVMSTLQDPLPRLSAVPGSTGRAVAAPVPVSEPPAAPVEREKIWTQTGRADELHDAVAAGPAPAVLAAGRFAGAWSASAAQVPLPGAAQRAASAAGSSAPASAAPSSADRPVAVAPRDESAAGSPAVVVAAQAAASKTEENNPLSAAPGRPSSAGSASPRERIAEAPGTVSESLWKAARRAAAAEAAGADAAAAAAGRGRRKHRPLLRRHHQGPLKPPKLERWPARNPWDRPAPKTLDDGRPLEPRPPETVQYVEAVVPPSGTPDRVPAPHWHGGIAVHYFHDGEAWGRAQDGRWTWLERSSGRWFLWADPKDPPLVWHEDHWWWQSRGTWFVLHDGEAWIYRYLDEWQQEGLAHPDGSRMLYSRDGKAVGVLEPKDGALFYDAAGGAQVSRLSDAQTPKPHRPRVPSAVSLPR